MDFRIQLEVYRGPLELLLYLVRKHELHTLDLSLSEIADQYLAYLDHASILDVNEVGDFIDLASTLVEMKSRHVLPHPEDQESGATQVEDLRDDLVDRLLDYKAIKDAASMLDERSQQWQQRKMRLVDDLTPPRVERASQPIDELEVWDLVNAYSRFQKNPELGNDNTIVYDDTPMQVHMQGIWERLLTNPQVEFTSALRRGMHKTSLIGMFLAVLELMRHQRVCAEQDAGSGELLLRKGRRFEEGWQIVHEGSAA